MKKYCILIAVLLIVWASGCSMGYIQDDPNYTDKSQKHELVSIKTAEIGSGRIFLLIGYYEEKMVFRFYHKDKDGVIYLSEVEAKYCSIVEEETDSPYVFIRKGWETSKVCQFHIPTGSIMQEIDMDISN